MSQAHGVHGVLFSNPSLASARPSASSVSQAFADWASSVLAHTAWDKSRAVKPNRDASFITVTRTVPPSSFATASGGTDRDTESVRSDAGFSATSTEGASRESQSQTEANSSTNLPDRPQVITLCAEHAAAATGALKGPDGGAQVFQKRKKGKGGKKKKKKPKTPEGDIEEPQDVDEESPATEEGDGDDADGDDGGGEDGEDDEGNTNWFYKLSAENRAQVCVWIALGSLETIAIGTTVACCWCKSRKKRKQKIHSTHIPLASLPFQHGPRAELAETSQPGW